MQVIDSVFFSMLIVFFEARLEKIFKQLKFLRFPVKCGHRCGKWLWQFGNSVDVIMKVRRIAVICQLLEGQQNLVCFDRRRGILAAELRLTGRTVLFLLSWKCTRGALRDFLVNSCHHVTAITNLFSSSCHHVTAAKTLALNSCHHVTVIFLARISHRLVAEDACFRMRITLGVVLICSMFCTKCVPGHHRSIRMYSVLYPESNFWWVFRNGSGLVP